MCTSVFTGDPTSFAHGDRDVGFPKPTYSRSGGGGASGATRAGHHLVVAPPGESKRGPRRNGASPKLRPLVLCR